jgi:excisionase family DNA binding protein
MSRLLTADQVAEQLQVPKTWVYRAARGGSLPSVPCGRYVRFHPDDLAKWIEAQRAASIAGNVNGPAAR